MRHHEANNTAINSELSKWTSSDACSFPSRQSSTYRATALPGTPKRGCESNVSRSQCEREFGSGGIGGSGPAGRSRRLGDVGRQRSGVVVFPVEELPGSLARRSFIHRCSAGCPAKTADQPPPVHGPLSYLWRGSNFMVRKEVRALNVKGRMRFRPLSPSVVAGRTDGEQARRTWLPL